MKIFFKKSSLKLVSLSILQVCLRFASAIFCILQGENPLQIMENAFYITENAIFARKTLLPRHVAALNIT